MDTRYLISNSKDQSIKLWDMRRFADQSTIEESRKIANKVNNTWDYRYDAYGPRRKNSFIFLFKNIFRFFYLAQKYDIPGDTSVRTYRGHSISYTLIRCYFSPSFTTGQKYIITGSSDGCIRSLYLLIFLSNKIKFIILVYDVLTGATKLCLRITNSHVESRDKCVRDVAWHPYENYIISTSVRF